MVKEDMDPTRRAPRAGLLCMLVAVVALGLAPSAQACNNPLSQPFKRWNDSAYYTPAPGGTMESASGWTLSGGASIVSGNEPWYVNSASDSHSLRLPAGSKATSAYMCVDTSYTTMRLFARNTGLATGTLKLEVLYKDPTTGAVKTLQTSNGIALLPTWAVSNKIALASGQVATYADGTGRVAFRLTSSGIGGNWQVDDLLVDPRRR